MVGVIPDIASQIRVGMIERPDIAGRLGAERVVSVLFGDQIGMHATWKPIGRYSGKPRTVSLAVLSRVGPAAAAKCEAELREWWDDRQAARAKRASNG